jgi:hypothetical protein
MTQPWGPNILAAPMEMAGLGIGAGSPELDGLQHSPRSPELEWAGCDARGGAVGCGTRSQTSDRETGSGSSCGGRAGRWGSARTRNSHHRIIPPRSFGRGTDATARGAVHGSRIHGAGSGKSRCRREGDRRGWERVSLAGDAEHGTGVGDVDGDGVESFREGEGQLVESGDGDGGGVEE